jgi:cyanophycinase
MSPRKKAGSLVLVGGGEFRAGCREFDAELVAAAGTAEVVVLPTAAAYEHPERVGARAAAHFEGLGATVRTLDVLHRGEAEDPKNAEVVRAATFVYLADGSPLHLRSVLKDSALFEALLASYHGGGVLAVSGAGAAVLCDPMVDPRGGAYTVGLGVVRNLAVFPYHGTAADHLRERSIDLLPTNATLVGVDEETALVCDPSGTWRVAGSGHVTVYDAASSKTYESGTDIPGLTGD